MDHGYSRNEIWCIQRQSRHSPKILVAMDKRSGAERVLCQHGDVYYEIIISSRWIELQAVMTKPARLFS
jgi:hypothetical protein